MLFIIFKGKHNSYLYKILQNLKVFKDKLIYITTNENAWMTSDLFIEYIENIIEKDYKKKTSYNGSLFFSRYSYCIR